MYRHRVRRPNGIRYPRIIQQPPRISLREMRWRRVWPYRITFVLATLTLLFTLIIFILEIVSLAIDDSNTLSNTASTGAGIWCSISFILAIVCAYLLVFVYKRSRVWSTYTLVANLIALLFIFILIAFDANAITPYNTMISTAPKKIQVLKGQLAVAILMILLPLSFLTIYIYTAFVSLVPYRAHAGPVHPPIPIPRYAKY